MICFKNKANAFKCISSENGILVERRVRCYTEKPMFVQQPSFVAQFCFRFEQLSVLSSNRLAATGKVVQVKGA